MIGGLTEEQEELRALARDFLADTSSIARVRALVDSGAARDDDLAVDAGELELQALELDHRRGRALLGGADGQLGDQRGELGRQPVDRRAGVIAKVACRRAQDVGREVALDVERAECLGSLARGGDAQREEHPLLVFVP